MSIEAKARALADEITKRAGAIWETDFVAPLILAFAAEVRRDERKRAAHECDVISKSHNSDSRNFPASSRFHGGGSHAAKQCADVIRALSAPQAAPDPEAP